MGKKKVVSVILSWALVALVAGVLLWGPAVRGHPMAEAQGPEQAVFTWQSEYNVWTAGASELHLPFINTDATWEWSTTAVVQNTSASPSMVTLKYYSTDGTLVTTTVDTLAAYGSGEYATVDAVGSGFSGSLWIASTQSVVAMVNETTIGPRDGDGLMSYRGAAGGDMSVDLRPVFKEYYGYNSFFAVQNTTGISTIANIDFVQTGLPDPVHSLTDTLPAHSAHFYDAQAIVELPSGFDGWVLIESPAPLVGVVHCVGEGGGAVAYGGTVAHDNHHAQPVLPFMEYLPRLARNYGDGFSSAIAVYTLGTQTTNIVAEFLGQDGVVLDVAVATVPPGAMWSVYLPGLPALPDGFLGSGVVSSDQPIATIAQTTGSVGGGYPLAGHSGIGGPDPGGTIVSVPYVRRNAGGTTTLFSVQNVGPDSANALVTFLSEDGSVADTDNASIPAQAAHTFDQEIGDLPDGFRGSAIIVSSQPVAVIGHVGSNPPSELPPSVGAFEPNGGSGSVGEWTDFTTTYTDPNGYEDIALAFFSLGREPPITSGGLAAAYYEPANALLLLGGDACQPGQSRFLATEYVVLDCGSSSVSGTGDTLTIHWHVAPRQCFVGGCGWNYAVELVTDSAGLQDAGLVGWWSLNPPSGPAGADRQVIRPTAFDLDLLREEIGGLSESYLVE